MGGTMMTEDGRLPSGTGLSSFGSSQQAVSPVPASIPSAAENTDKELWRSAEDYYCDRVTLVNGGGIGMCAAFGHVIVKTVGEWHFLSNEVDRLRKGWDAFPKDVAAVLNDMGDGDYCKHAPQTAIDLGLDVKRVQEINRALKVLGFARCGPLMTDEGAVAGQGYWVTAAGERFATALHLAAIATEAGTAETTKIGSVHEGAGRNDIAQKAVSDE